MNFDPGIPIHQNVTSLFQADTLLSAQYYDTVRRRTHMEPEKRLMLAVLEDAVSCFQRYIFARDRRGKTLHREAEEWIVDPSSDWPFSFESICEVLGLSPGYVRRGLCRWKEEMLAAYPEAEVYFQPPGGTPKAHTRYPGGVAAKNRSGRLLSSSCARALQSLPVGRLMATCF